MSYVFFNRSVLSKVGEIYNKLKTPLSGTEKWWRTSPLRHSLLPLCARSRARACGARRPWGRVLALFCPFWLFVSSACVCAERAIPVSERRFGMKIGRTSSVETEKTRNPSVLCEYFLQCCLLPFVLNIALHKNSNVCMTLTLTLSELARNEFYTGLSESVYWRAVFETSHVQRAR